MSRDFGKELEGFEKLWRRVAGEKPRLPEKIKLMPGKDGRGRGRKPFEP